MIASRMKHYASLVALSHTVFALPFAASAVVLARAEGGAITLPRIVAILVCLVAARTSAMAFNRWADRDVDAKNPRTKGREVPSGKVSPRAALALALGSGALFVASAATLGLLCALLAPLVLAWLLGYSYAKRFTWAAHLWLGVALALAPGGAWLAVGAPPGAGIVLLLGAVATWLFGFDVLYSLQDETFDRAHGLHSVPARFGTRRALVLSAAAHVVTICALAAAGVVLHRGGFFAAGVSVVSLLLVVEHAIVGKGDLRRIDKAFFDVNAWVSVAFFAFTVTDEVLRAGG